LLKTEINNISEQEFRTVIRILAGLDRSIGDTKVTLAAEIKHLKTGQAKTKNAMTVMQNCLDVITSRMEEAEDQIDDVEDKIMENNEAEKKMERKLLDNEYRLRELSDSTKHNNICIIGVPEEEEWGKRG